MGAEAEAQQGEQTLPFEHTLTRVQAPGVRALLPSVSSAARAQPSVKHQPHLLLLLLLGSERDAKELSAPARRSAEPASAASNAEEAPAPSSKSTASTSKSVHGSPGERRASG